MHKWTEEQTNYLKTMFADSDITYTDMTKTLNKEFNIQLSLAQVMKKLKDEELYRKKPTTSYVRYTQEQIDFLWVYGDNHTCAEIAAALNKKFHTDHVIESVRRVLDRYDIPYVKRNNTTRFYTDEQIKFIEEHSEESYSQIADAYYKEYGIVLLRGSVSYVCKRYGIKHEDKRNFFVFSEEKLEFIKNNISKMTVSNLMELYKETFNENISREQVKKLVKEYNLTTVTRGDLTEPYIQTSFHLSKSLYNEVTRIANCLNISVTKFIYKSIDWFIDNGGEVSDYIKNDLHLSGNSCKKDYLRTIRFPVSLYTKLCEYTNTKQYKKGDIILQSLLDYCNYVDTSLDNTKYLAENWF